MESEPSQLDPELEEMLASAHEHLSEVQRVQQLADERIEQQDQPI